MASLPNSFAYFVSSLGGVNRRSVRLSPNNTQNPKQSEQITFVLPTDSIVDLTTLQFIYKFKYQNAPTADKHTIRYAPCPEQLVRSVVWSINNQAVAGANNQHFSQVLQMLKRASCGNDNPNSRCDEYSECPVHNLCGNKDDGSGSAKVYGNLNERVASNTIARKGKLTDFLCLQSSPNAPNWDTSIVGETRIQLQLNGSEACLHASDEASIPSGGADWELQDCEMRVDVISFASPEYDMLMSAMLEEGSLNIPFNEYTTQKSLINSNVRFNVASQSLDAVMFALLNSGHTDPTHIQTSTGKVKGENFGTGLTPNQITFQYRKNGSTTLGTGLASGETNMSDAVDATWYWNINGSVYPSSGATQMVEGAEYTKQLFAGGKDDYNQLFKGYYTNGAIKEDGTVQDVIPSSTNLESAKQYKRVNYLDNNAICAIRLCLDVPASQSDKHTMSGLNTLGQSSQLSLNLNGFNNNNDSVLLVGQGSSVISVSAGQQVSVIN